MKSLNINSIVANALKEDIRQRDITTDYLVSKDHVSLANIIVKEEAVVCGLAIVKTIFRKLDPSIKIKFFVKDGQKAKKGKIVAQIKGKTRAILTGERVSLNFLGYLSGISTITNRYVNKVKPYKVKILDTRKTLPGLRALEKAAVRYGGGFNHRFSLNDMVLIKDNHLMANKKVLAIKDAIKLLRKKTKKKIEVEVDYMYQYKEALESDPDIIMLDNMSVKEIKKAVALREKLKKKILLEASGGITLKRVRTIARTGVDLISIGALTHSSKDIDFSIEIKE